MRLWTVAGALIHERDQVVLVGNRRRDGSLEWTPPGGVIDHGESVLDGLAREVHEETGLTVTGWSDLAYVVTVDAPDMGWRLGVEVWAAAGVSGRVVVADPDGIVEVVRHVPVADAADLLALSPPWVHVPMGDWLAGRAADSYRFVLHGTSRQGSRVERLQ